MDKIIKQIKFIKKRNGQIVVFDSSKITKAIYKATEAIGSPNYNLSRELAFKVVKKLSEMKKETIPAVEQIQNIVEQILMEAKQSRTAKAYILYRGKRTEIRKQKQIILEKQEIDEVDKRFDINALRVLKSRYLKKDASGKLIESPRELFQRVAVHAVLPSLLYDEKIFKPSNKDGGNIKPLSIQTPFEPKKLEGKIKLGKFFLNQFHLKALQATYDRLNRQNQMKVSWSDFLSKLKKGDFNKYESEVIDYYNLMVERKFMPNTPILANFGNYLGNGSACFVLDINDSLEDIMETLKNAAIIFKSGGGVGYNFSKLRPEGDFVKTTGGISSGPISFLTLFDKMTDVVKQGGIRRGASIGILDIDHPDIEKFITAKRENKMLKNFNISVFVKENFWPYYKRNKLYPLINPRTGKKIKEINPNQLLDLISYQIWESAEPGLIFDEHINKYNPFYKSFGPIKATNPCITKDAWIATSKGPRQVKDLIGQKIDVVVDNQLWTSLKEGFFCTGVKLLFKLETKEGFELSLTEDHLVRKVKKMTRYIITSEWGKTKDLKPGDKLLLNINKNLEWEGGFGKKEGYLIGALIGDGTFPRYPKKNKYRLSIAHLKKIAEELKVDRYKKITPEIEKTSSNFYKGFLRGFFDTDGSVQGTPKKGIKVRLSQSDLNRLRATQRMLLRLGIFSKIYLNRRKAQKRNMPDGKPQHELEISIENLLVFSKRIGFENSDKSEKLEKLLKGYSRKLKQERFIVTVKKISPLRKRRVFDIQIPGENAFEANGFYIKNCGEIPLYPGGSCNLGSLNVWAFVKEEMTNGKKRRMRFDWEGFEKAIQLAIKFLDNAIDINQYPLEEIKKMSLGTRKIGLGLMGLGNLLYELEIGYNTKQGFNFMEKLMEYLNYHSKLMSVELAKQRGKFPFYKKSFYPESKLPFRGSEDKGPRHLLHKVPLNWSELKDKILKYGIRNAHTLTNAPTGSISMIAGCSSGIEPVYSLVFEKEVTVGSFYYVDPVFEKIMTRQGLFDDELIKDAAKANGSVQNIAYIPTRFKKIFVAAMDIKPEIHLKALSCLQKWTDASISKTINLPTNATAKQIKETILLAYKLKCKDITLFRDKSIKGVLKAGEMEQKEGRSRPSDKEKLINFKDVKAKGLSIYASGNVSYCEQSTEFCPECGQYLIDSEGCKKCPSCGWGMCGT